MVQFTIVVKNQEAAWSTTHQEGRFREEGGLHPSRRQQMGHRQPQGGGHRAGALPGWTDDPNGWSSRWQAGNNPPIVLRVDDCRKVFAELMSREVEFKQSQPAEYAWGVSATFSDPDGNLISINQPPAAKSWSRRCRSSPKLGTTTSSWRSRTTAAGYSTC